MKSFRKFFNEGLGEDLRQLWGGRNVQLIEKIEEGVFKFFQKARELRNKYLLSPGDRYSPRLEVPIDNQEGKLGPFVWKKIEEMLPSPGTRQIASYLMKQGILSTTNNAKYLVAYATPYYSRRGRQISLDKISEDRPVYWINIEALNNWVKEYAIKKYKKADYEARTGMKGGKFANIMNILGGYK